MASALFVLEPEAFWTAIIGDAVLLLGTMLAIVGSIWVAQRTLARQLNGEASARREEQAAEWAQRRAEQQAEWDRHRSERIEERQFQARAIGEEVTLIGARIIGYHQMRAAISVNNPPAPIDTSMFDAVGGRIGELRSARHIVIFYTQARLLTQLIRDWASTQERIEMSSQGSSETLHALRARVHELHDGFFKMSRTVVMSAEALIPRLQSELIEPPPVVGVHAAQCDR
jgi:hypothetical protein